MFVCIAACQQYKNKNAENSLPENAFIEIMLSSHMATATIKAVNW